MFDIGGPEFVFLMLLALLVFGPRRLPEIGRTLGKYAAHFRRSWIEMRRTLEREVALDDVRGVGREVSGLETDARRFVRELTGSVPKASVPAAPPSPPKAAEPAQLDAEPPVESEPAEERP